MLAQLLSYGATALLVAFLVSAGAAWALVASSRWHLHRTDDHERHLPQKIHQGAVPRVGGIAIALGVIAGGGVTMYVLGQAVPSFRAMGLLMGAMPVLLVGLAEDVFKGITPRQRLLWAALGALIAVQYSGIALVHTDIPAVDWFFTIYGVAIGFTVVAIVGSTNAFNIIDGLNGLLGGVTVITMAGIAVVALGVNDTKVALLAGVVAASTCGFLLFNWPRARLFAGDGGAYFLGFSVAALLLLLVARNPTVSPWFGLTAAALPVCETVHSIWRRVERRMAATAPDVGHLHQLLREGLLQARMLRAVRAYRAARASGDAPRTLRNQGFRLPNGSLAPWLWILHGVPVLLGVLVWDKTGMQIAVFAGFVGAYLLIYRRLAHFAHRRLIIHYDPATGMVARTHKAPCAPAPIRAVVNSFGETEPPAVSPAPAPAQSPPHAKTRDTTPR